MDTIYYVKLLRLVTPEAAFWLLGLPATDAPVFVSPYVQTPGRCRTRGCRIIYAPLVYAPGLVTQSHHFHCFDGGIYLHAVHNPRDPRVAAFGPHGFLAFVEPLGQCRSFSSELRAEAVRVISIAAYETPNRIGAYRTLYRTGNVTWLTEGLLREGRLNTGLEPGTLLPVRAGEDRRPGAMRFSVRDGAVTFTED